MIILDAGRGAPSACLRLAEKTRAGREPQPIGARIGLWRASHAGRKRSALLHKMPCRSMCQPAFRRGWPFVARKTCGADNQAKLEPSKLSSLLQSDCRPVKYCEGAGLSLHERPVVRVEGLEPPRLAAPEPKSGASANSATPACPARDNSGPARDLAPQ